MAPPRCAHVAAGPIHGGRRSAVALALVTWLTGTPRLSAAAPYHDADIALVPLLGDARVVPLDRGRLALGLNQAQLFQLDSSRYTQGQGSAALGVGLGGGVELV